MNDAATIPLADQIAELKRELALRNGAYPRFIEKGTLKPEAAARQTARMQAALQTLIALQKDGA